ncbi:MAG: hypothetical protein ABJZ55_00745 [Fuerstiella sp.]
MYQIFKDPKFRIVRLIFVAVFTLSFAVDSAYADNYVVLDGLGGLHSKSMEPEVQRLQSMGHNVTYRPWWRWRSAVRATNGPVNVIGYSLGGSRANRFARKTDVRSMELIDPVRVVGKIRLPKTAMNTTVYRASSPTVIRSSKVRGRHSEVRIPTNHSGIPARYHSMKRR